MLGAVVGDILGSSYKRCKPENMDFPLFPKGDNQPRCTEISVMTLAVAEALMHAMKVPGNVCTAGQFRGSLIYWMRAFGRKIKKIIYGRKFFAWLHVKAPQAYDSQSNGSVLRVSPIAWVFDNLEDVERFAEIAARVTNKNQNVVSFARVMAGMIFFARMKKSKDEIKNYFQERSGLELTKTFEELRENFDFITTCPETLSAALTAFLEGENFEDVIRKAIFLGGETTATASMAGAIAEAFYGVKISIEAEAFEKIPRRLQYTIEKWEQWKF
ncbi:MAG: ADP-ribosylglycohydrolase family protein [Synergistaceae bacterium]|nr:ADP-ribosylglycohydrolase family protein [Synergistaceae bacterium]